MTRTKVLYVDDNLTNLDLIQRTLERKGYHCMTVQSSVQSIDIARTYQPDLMLLDIQMPDLDGYQLLQTLRSDVLITDVPAIAVTANAMPGDRQRCLDAGFDDYMAKPIYRQALILMIEKHLNAASV